MDCVEVGALLEALHDGAVNQRMRAALVEHLATCPSCGVALARLQALSGLLQQSSQPSPSSELDARLVGAFRQQHARRAPQRAWWRSLFVGSVSVPKPAFAALALSLAVMLLGAIEWGRVFSTPRPANTLATQNVPLPAPPPASPQVLERTKLVEVPVVHVRVVTRTVYNARAQRNAREARNQAQTAEQNYPNLAMSDSIAEHGYLTRAKLAGFQPANEMKARIIKEVKVNEQ